MQEKISIRKSRIPIDIDDLIFDLHEHYTRLSRIAKNTETEDNSFAKTYVILKDIAKTLVDTMKIRGIEQSESLDDLLKKVPETAHKKISELVIRYARTR